MKALLTILSAASLGGWLTLYGPNETASGSAEAQEYAIDPEHSVVVFRTKHLGVSNFYGRFNEVAGRLT